MLDMIKEQLHPSDKMTNGIDKNIDLISAGADGAPCSWVADTQLCAQPPIDTSDFCGAHVCKVTF